MEQTHSETHRKPHERDDEAARWMTPAELSPIRGTSKRAAITLIRRHGWRRQRDNWLAGDAKPWHPDAVVVSDRLVFRPQLTPVA